MIFFFFNDTATTEIYTLSLHDALPICEIAAPGEVLRLIQHIGHAARHAGGEVAAGLADHHHDAPGHVFAAVIAQDRKSTRLNSSHANISYAVFCLKKKKK